MFKEILPKVIGVAARARSQQSCSFKYEGYIQPRFNETDALGHINNTVLTQWFEGARDPIFKLFTPDLDVGCQSTRSGIAP